jgi:Ca2+-binding RTX toxin-like protein/uncharacterized membrane protein YGL010W
MPTMTVYIAERGTSLVSGGTSAAGHMWYSISSDGIAEQQSFGFGSATHGIPGGVGRVFRDDIDNYESYAYTKSIFITQAQYDALKSFGENPASRGFDPTEYNWAVNSCVDFTYKALSIISNTLGGYEGHVIPSWNIQDQKLRAVIQDLEIRNAVDPVPGPSQGDGAAVQAVTVSVDKNAAENMLGHPFDPTLAEDVNDVADGISNGTLTAAIDYVPSQGNGRFTIQSDNFTQNKIVMSAGASDNAILIVQNGQTKLLLLNGNDGSSRETEFDLGNTRIWDERDISTDASEKVTNVQVKLNNQSDLKSAVNAVDYSAIGQVFGSAIGRAIAGNDNQFLSLAAGTVAGFVGQKFVQTLLSGSTAINLADLDISDVFFGQQVSLAGAGLGAASSFLTAELATSIGLNGVGAQMFNAAVGGYVGSVLNQVRQQGFNVLTANINWDAALHASEINIASAFGSLLAHQFRPAESQYGAIGGQLAGAVGSALAYAFSTTLGTVLNVAFPGIGAFFGTIIGTIIGDVIAGDPGYPKATHDVEILGSDYHFQNRLVGTDDHGNAAVSQEMGDQVTAIANSYLDAVHGAAIDHRGKVMIGYNAGAAPYSYVAGWFPDGTGAVPHFAQASDAVQEGVRELLMQTEVIGGDLLLKRAHQAFINRPHADPYNNPSDFTDLAGLGGDLRTAQDYQQYLNDRDTINALIELYPNSAFTAGWAATFARVKDLKLNQYGANDFLGGLVGYLDSVSKAGLGFDAANVAVKHSGNSDTVEIKVPNGADIPGALSVFASQTSQSSDASGTTVKFVVSEGLAAAGFHTFASWQGSGDGANVLWFGADVVNNFDATASRNAILIGGASTDTLTGGNGWDFIDGGAGNDTLTGAAGNDILRGGPGGDWLYGGQGNDTYTLARGDGADIAIDNYRYMELDSAGSGGLPGSGGGSSHEVHSDAGADTLAFGAGIRITDIDMQFIGSDLFVGLRGPNVPASQLADRITLTNWGDARDRIEFFSFADGSTVSISGIFAHGGTAGPDALTWSDAAAWLDGGGGNDFLTTGDFNDTLRGGPGNDFLIGGGGTDTAVYDGPASAYTVVSYNGAVAVLSHGVDGNDALVGIEKIQFADRTIATAALAAFDAWEYLASNADLIANIGANPQAGYNNYITSGFNAGVPTNAFDAVEYIASNPDLIVGHFTAAMAERHYVGSGYLEHRPTNAFDALEYLASNPDLIQAHFTPASARQHYVANGYFEHRPTTSFDALEYLASNPDLISPGVTAAMGLQHYVANGYFEHRPTTSFDALEFLASNYDLIEAHFTPAAAMQHYVSLGYFGHRATTSFDALEYLASNPDLISPGVTAAMARQHYVANGYFEHRPTTSFDGLEYLASNPDLISPGVTAAMALQHYVANGYFEHRPTTSFDGLEYLASNPDLISPGVTAAMALQHYVANGYFEHRPTTSFDALEYLASNPDLMLGGVMLASAAQHYVSNGYLEHRAAHSFDPLQYLASNPDLIQLGLTAATATQHYVDHGFFEQRPAHSFDALEYLASNPWLLLGGVTVASAAWHYVNLGYFEQRPAHSFDPLQYLASNPDLIQLGLTAANATQHYVDHGFFEQRPANSFDATEYLASNPDMIQSGFTPASALQHYVGHGYFEHRATNSFDATEYLASNPDMIQSGFTPASALQHYVGHGYFEHRATTTFDATEYLASNPDMIQAGFTPASALQHYVGHGYFEHRATASFDATEYLASNPDMIQAGFTPASALQHYVAHGYFEHRATNSFDATEYLASNPDMIQAGFTPASALQHYVAHGYFEHRVTTTFDATEYLASNPDMIQVGFTPASALQHYVAHGYFEHRVTTTFDATEYLASNPDMIQVGFTPASALQHYVAHGYFEHRVTTTFDATEYLASNPDLIAVHYTPAMALQHYVGHGYFEHRATTSFDPLEYLASNPDLIAVHYTPAVALQHYVNNGYFEHRATTSFDAAQYLANYADLSAYFGPNNLIAAEQHYVSNGFSEGRTDHKPSITGDGAANTLVAKNGAIMTGGGGADNFVFNASLQTPATVTDFTVGADHLQISASGFGHGLTAGGAAPLVTAAAAASASHAGTDGYFIFDNANTLSWDPTGGSGADAIALVKLTGIAALHASDFLLA